MSTIPASYVREFDSNLGNDPLSYDYHIKENTSLVTNNKKTIFRLGAFISSIYFDYTTLFPSGGKAGKYEPSMVIAPSPFGLSTR